MITLAFLFLFCICILCCFLTQKSTLSDAFLVSFSSVRCYFWCFADSPCYQAGGHHREVVRFVKMLRYPLVSCRYPVFSVNACIYSTLSLSCVNTLGLAPKPQPHLRRRRQAVKTQPPDPVAKCWVGSRRQG